MFSKLLRSVGIGAAKVDTILTSATCVPGGAIQGEIRIRGGNGAQDIEKIYMAITTEYEYELDEGTLRLDAELNNVPISGRFTVQPGQELAMPFSIPVPLNTPVTMGRVRVWSQTGLDIKGALDPQDRDYLDVRPHPLVEAFLASAERLGFRLYQVDCEQSKTRFNGLPFVQEFEFKPYSGAFFGKLDELEAVFQLTDAGATVRLQIDRRARNLSSLFAESLGLDESYTGFSYTQADIPNLDQMLYAAIQQYA